MGLVSRMQAQWGRHHHVASDLGSHCAAAWKVWRNIPTQRHRPSHLAEQRAQLFRRVCAV